MIYRVLGTTDEELRDLPSESNVIELARLLFFLCVVAYNMRTIEMRCALQAHCAVIMLASCLSVVEILFDWVLKKQLRLRV